MENEILPFGGPRAKKARNTKRRITWRNYSFAFTNVWQLFDERREVWIGPAPIATIKAFRQQLYEHRYLIAEAADLGDTEAQALMMKARDVSTELIEEGEGQARLHIIPNPAIALVNKALQEAGVLDEFGIPEQLKPPGTDIESIREQLKKTP